MTDLHLNHISARVPGKEEHFLINPFGMMYEEITASSLIKIDLAGNIIANANPDYGGSICRVTSSTARSTARATMSAVCSIPTPMPAWRCRCSSAGCCRSPRRRCAGRKVAYHDFEGVVVDLDEQKRLVDDLGDCEVMILRNHGLLAVGKTIGQAFNNIYRLERACQTQLLAMACNAEINMPASGRLSHARTRNSPSCRRPTPRVSASPMARWNGRRSSACSTAAIRPAGPDAAIRRFFDTATSASLWPCGPFAGGAISLLLSDI